MRGPSEQPDAPAVVPAAETAAVKPQVLNRRAAPRVAKVSTNRLNGTGAEAGTVNKINKSAQRLSVTGSRPARSPSRTATVARAKPKAIPLEGAGLKRARTALVYVSDDMPGMTRLKHAGGFRYRDADGNWITDADEISRINKLAIPPAYARVWICPVPNGHLQATGIDARGRKQYRYHADWQAQRNDSKFERLQSFGAALPRLRARVDHDLAAPASNKKHALVSRTLVLATIVRLLDTTYARVGNDEYARENGSFGLTTLRNPHAAVRGATLQLRFRGKSGVMQDLKVTDPKVARVVRNCQQLPGQALFQYQDENGELHAVGSGDVNEYLAQIAGPKGDDADVHFTAKDFRTWHGTVQALELTRLACTGNIPDAYNAKSILKEVARQLGNTPAVCRKSYIHPAVLNLGSELAKEASVMASTWKKLAAGKPARRLHAAEARLLTFLKAHQTREAHKGAVARQKVRLHAKAG